MKILVVDDDPETARLLRGWYRLQDVEILEAANGDEGLRRATSEKPDIILMDLSLPVMDGWEATRHVKADQALRHVPVIGLTAHAMSGDREKALEAGCDEYDTKPVEIDRLIEKIERLLGERQDR